MIKKSLISVFHLPYLPLWLAPLVLISPVLFTGKALFWGTPYLQFVPWRALAVQILQSGQLPLWNPFNGMGTPLLANYQSGLLYPPNWFLLALQGIGGTAAQAWGQAVVIVFHWILASVGMALLVRRMGVNQLGQAVSGLAFGMSAYLVTRAFFLSMNATLAWLPWVVLLSCRIASPLLPDDQARTYRLFGRVVPLGVVIGLMLLAGHAQTSWYSLILAVLWVVVWSLRKGGWGGLLRSLGEFIFAVVLGAGLAAAQLLPTAEFLLQSQRASAVDYQLAMNYSFWPWHLLTLLAPGMFGTPVSGDYWYAAYYWEDAIYIGILPLLLGLLGALQIIIKRKATNYQSIPKDYLNLVVLLLGMLPIILLLAFGRNTPIFPALYRYIPTFNMFQAPARWMIWVVFALALLAGLGVQVWKRPEGKALYWARLATAGAAAVLIGSGAAWALMGEITPTFIRATALAGLFGFAVGVLNLSKPVQTSQPWLKLSWPWAVVLFVAFDLIIVNWGMNPGIRTDFYREPATGLSKVSQILNGQRLYVPRVSEDVLKYDRFFQVKTFTPTRSWEELKGYLLANANILAGISSVNNYDPLVSGRYARWMEQLEQVGPDMRSAMLKWMDVGAVERPDDKLVAGVSIEPFQGLARLHWSSCAVSANNEGDAWRLFSQMNSFSQGEDSLRDGVPLVVEGVTILKPTSCKMSGVAKIDIIDENTQQLNLQITADQGGWLVQADTWYPGWRAVLDGKPVPIRVANTLFRAIEIPSGTHTLVIEYRPRSFAAGAGISLLTVVGMLAWFVIERKKVGEYQTRGPQMIKDEGVEPWK
jgi:hypothetical protein